MGGDALISKAWDIYCKETAGDMHVADHWDQLPLRVQAVYCEEARRQCPHEVTLPYYEDNVILGCVYYGHKCTVCGSIEYKK